MGLPSFIGNALTISRTGLLPPVVPCEISKGLVLAAQLFQLALLLDKYWYLRTKITSLFISVNHKLPKLENNPNPFESRRSFACLFALYASSQREVPDWFGSNCGLA